MITSVKVTNPQGESIILELWSPEKSGLQVLGIEGLGPPKADINMVGILNSDGSFYNSARLSSRNIVFNFGFLENSTIEETRLITYKYFPIKKKVDLAITTDERVGIISGYVESNEPDIFSKKEGSRISIICPNPYFYSADTQTSLFSGSLSAFNFPFSNESLTLRLLVFSELYNNLETNIYYQGDSEIGVTIYVRFTGPVVNPVIYNSRTLEHLTIDTTKLATLTGSGFISGDELYISTIKGAKTVTLVRLGSTINILNAVDKNADWPVLSPLDNIFRYNAVSGIENMLVSISNQIIYEGL